MNVFYFCSELYSSVVAVSIISLLENNRTFLPGVVSRKKQIIPMLEENIKN